VKKFLEKIRVKLFPIIDSKFLGYPESAYGVLPKELSDSFGGYTDQWLCFNPPSEVLYSDYGVLIVSLSRG
jgi:hypothetical protein